MYCLAPNCRTDQQIETSLNERKFTNHSKNRMVLHILLGYQQEGMINDSVPEQGRF